MASEDQVALKDSFAKRQLSTGPAGFGSEPAGGLRAFEDLPDGELRRVRETNFFGVMALTRALLPTFRKQRSGRTVVVSSEAAFHGYPCNSIYAASKWAVEGWAESLAFEVERFGIDVVLVEPGPYVTDIWDTSPRNAPAEVRTGDGARTYSVPAMRMWQPRAATRWWSPRRSPTSWRHVGPGSAIPWVASLATAASRGEKFHSLGSPGS